MTSVTVVIAGLTRTDSETGSRSDKHRLPALYTDRRLGCSAWPPDLHPPTPEDLPASSGDTGTFVAVLLTGNDCASAFTTPVYPGSPTYLVEDLPLAECLAQGFSSSSRILEHKGLGLLTPHDTASPLRSNASSALVTTPPSLYLAFICRRPQLVPGSTPGGPDEIPTAVRTLAS
ncbi:hypothetical protein O3P69_006226 [Scylla paramamosain]|uniref:Uncharacterized protein n=1 Tax=Scylla paramamosain TaxID=85552 RepID=A0AAW0U5S8_SCYPA